MEFRNLRKQYLVLQEKIEKAISEVLENGNYISGNQVRHLEKQLAEYVGIKHCITCANGTDALSVSLRALNIQSGDAVFVPDFTFFATAEAVAFCGATPIFVDVNEYTYNIECDKLEENIEMIIKQGKLQPKAIVTVDLFGQPANYLELVKIAEKYSLLVIEDAAQGFGGSIAEKKAGSFGDIATTSFFPAKPLGCYGDGGAIFTNDDGVAELIRSLCVHGKGKGKYDNVRIGVNSRLDTLQAAILLVKLEEFKNRELEEVNRIAMIYSKELAQYVTVPKVLSGFYSSWAQYVIQLPNAEIRDKIQRDLQSKGIPTMVYYPKPLHKQAAFAEYNISDEKYLVAINLAERVLALPIHPYMEEAEVVHVVNSIRESIKNEKE